MKYLLRIENLLLLAPLLFGVYSIIYFTFSSDPDFGFEPSAIVNLTIASSLNWMWTLVPGYIMHYFLRVVKRRNKVICFSHVIVSLVISYFTDGYGFATSVVPGWHTTIYPPLSGLNSFISYFAWFDVLFWIVQIVFLVYGFVLIELWRKPATS